MFKDKTVLVLGAGASHEAGLSLGTNLKSKIGKLTKFKTSVGRLSEGDTQFFEELRRGLPGTHANDILSACAIISNGINYVSSVDNFLEVHQEHRLVQVCAKCAICHIIAQEERASRLSVDPSNSHNKLDTRKLVGTWYLDLAHVAFEKVKISALADGLARLKIISFNYDRCIEWFLFNALKNLYNLDSNAASDAMKHLEIIHPYGSLGPLPWMNSTISEIYGPDFSGRLFSASARINTFTEDVSDQPEVEAAREAVSKARNIIFLGFSFHAQNLILLSPQPSGKSGNVSNVLGSAFEMSEQDIRTVSAQLSHLFNRRPNASSPYAAAEVALEPLKCADYLRRYKRTISE